jgi:hypothetical protein
VDVSTPHGSVPVSGISIQALRSIDQRAGQRGEADRQVGDRAEEAAGARDHAVEPDRRAQEVGVQQAADTRRRTRRPLVEPVELLVGLVPRGRAGGVGDCEDPGSGQRAPDLAQRGRPSMTGITSRKTRSQRADRQGQERIAGRRARES